MLMKLKNGLHYRPDDTNRISLKDCAEGLHGIRIIHKFTNPLDYRRKVQCGSNIPNTGRKRRSIDHFVSDFTLTRGQHFLRDH